MPTFTFTAYLTRGRMEREIEVEADYTFDGVEVLVTDAKDKTEGRELSDAEWDSVYEAACERCESDYAEWQADYGDYLYERSRERRWAA